MISTNPLPQTPIHFLSQVLHMRVAYHSGIEQKREGMVFYSRAIEDSYVRVVEVVAAIEEGNLFIRYRQRR